MQNMISQYKPYIYGGLGIIGLYILRKYFNGPKTNSTKSLKHKIVVITGASEGIGKETAFELLRNDATVVFACRDEKKTLEIISQIKNDEMRSRALFMKIDLASFDSIKNFCLEFKSKFERLDILVNNAGAVFKKFNKSSSGIESTLQINTFGPIILTQGLIDILHKSQGRIINVASKAYQGSRLSSEFYDSKNPELLETFEQDYSALKQYGISKIGNIYFTQYLYEYINTKKLNIKTASLHPGVIYTELARDYKNIFTQLIFTLIFPLFWLVTKTKNHGAQTTLHLCYLNDDEFVNGGYYSDCKPKALLDHASSSQNRESYIKFARRFINYYGKKSEIKLEL